LIVQVLQVCSLRRQLRLQAVDVNGKHLSLPIEYQLRLINKQGYHLSHIVSH